MRLPLFLALAALTACAEMTRPRAPEPPSALAGGVIVPQPLPVILDLATRDFDMAGANLQGHPAETALAVARLEWLGGEARPGRRLAELQPSYLFALRRAVAEARQIMAISPDAPAEATVPALLAAAAALRRDDTAAAEAALRGPAFQPTDRPQVRRLTEPGAFPDTALALPALREEVTRLIATNRADPALLYDNTRSGITTYGLGGTTDL
ncbi:hypothetical protein [Roseococcus sp. YIM B11640]|uniref:hypothetical protein n=1 Tax=Roseococcus sp. YIM B11640 TaxID=3133973 RepID=UPI003C799863